MPLSQSHRDEIKGMLPITKGDKVRLIEIIGVYRAILVDELRKATTTAERKAARQRYEVVLGEVDNASGNESTLLTNCYRAYCLCVVNPQGRDCRADLAKCLDNAPLPVADSTKRTDENEGITPDAGAV